MATERDSLQSTLQSLEGRIQSNRLDVAALQKKEQRLALALMASVSTAGTSSAVVLALPLSHAPLSTTVMIASMAVLGTVGLVVSKITYDRVCSGKQQKLEELNTLERQAALARGNLQVINLVGGAAPAEAGTVRIEPDAAVFGTVRVPRNPSTTT